MRFQLIKRVTNTLLTAKGALDYNSQRSEGQVALKEWSHFDGRDILITIKSHCPNTNTDLQDLFKWHVSIPLLKATSTFHDLFVGSIHKKVIKDSVRLQETTSFHLDIID